ncbi:ABC transporter ATP-binding protein, partial [Pontiella sp.]
MIKAVDLVKDFGQRRAVDGVSFEVQQGTVLGFLGPNGAGKTTTIRMVAGFLPPTQGNIHVKGINVASDPVAAQKSIGYMPETTPLYEDMSVAGFLRFLAEVRGFSGKERDSRVDRAIERCFLGPVRSQTIDTLSKGYR